ncbi:MAG: oligosaccharide flippase family protein [Gammaproteobacteria bacterium]
MSIRNRVLKGGMVVTVGQAVGVMLSLYIQHLLATNIHKNDVGMYFLLASFGGMFTIIINLGMDRAAVRLIAGEVARNNFKKAHEFVKRFLMTVTGSAFVFVLFYILFISDLLISSFVPDLVVVPAIFVAIWIGLESIKASIVEILRGFQKMTSVVLLGNILGKGLFAMTLFLVSLFLVEIEIKDVVLINCWVAAIILIAGGVLLKRIKVDPRVKLTADSKELYIIGPPIMGILLISTLNREVDLWIVSYFLTEEDTAVYGVASRLAQFVTILMMVVTSVLPPIISELYSTSKVEKLQGIMRATTLICTSASALMVLVFLLIGDHIIELIYTKDYLDAYMLLVVLGVGKLLGVIAGSSGLVLMMTNYQGLQLKILGATFCLSVILSIVLVPYFGAIGAAIASAIGMALQNIIMTYYVYKKLGIKVHLFYSPLIMRETLVHIYEYLGQSIKKF